MEHTARAAPRYLQQSSFELFTFKTGKDLTVRRCGLSTPFTSKTAWVWFGARTIKLMPKELLLMPTKSERRRGRDEVRLWVPKHDIIQKLDRLTAPRNRLIKVGKMMQSPLTDCKDFISKKDLSEAKKACQSTMQALDKDIKKVNRSGEPSRYSKHDSERPLFKRTARIVMVNPSKNSFIFNHF